MGFTAGGWVEAGAAVVILVARGCAMVVACNATPQNSRQSDACIYLNAGSFGVHENFVTR